MINILALETTGKYGSAAVITDDGSVYCASSEREMNHLKDIITISDEALRMAGITKGELTHVAASVGPGSFTGIRIGVTTARTLSQMLGVPCVSVSSLEIMADRVLSAAAASDASFIAAIINARRHQTYAGAWELDHNTETGMRGKTALLEEKQYMVEEFLDEIIPVLKDRGGNVMFTGDGIDAYEDIIREAFEDNGMPDRLILADEEIRYQNAGPAAEIALNKVRAEDVLTYDELLPEYMRLSEAEQRLREGTLSDKIRKVR